MTPQERRPRRPERPRRPVVALDVAHARRARRRRRRPARRVRAVLVVAGLGAAVLVGVGYTGAAAFRSSCSLASERPIPLGSNSFVYAANGAPLGIVPAARLRE